MRIALKARNRFIDVRYRMNPARDNLNVIFTDDLGTCWVKPSIAAIKGDTYPLRPCRPSILERGGRKGVDIDLDEPPRRHLRRASDVRRLENAANDVAGTAKPRPTVKRAYCEG